MEKVTIDFEMISLDTNVKFSTNGEYNKQKLKFVDNESNSHEIIFIDNIIEYHKIGSMDMKFKFDVNNITKGIYKVDNNSFVFDIVTTKLENTSNRLIVEYELIQNNEIINKSKLIIKYSITKEE